MSLVQLLGFGEQGWGGTLLLASAGAELVEGGASLGVATSMQREELHGRMIVALREKHRIPPYVDLPALLELLSAALTLFALRAAHAPGSRRAAIISRGSGQPQGCRLWSLLTVGHVDCHALALGQARDPGTLKRRRVHEDILAAVIRGNKTKPLGVVVPLHRAELLDRCSVGPRVIRTFRPRAAGLFLHCRASVNAQDFRHLRSLWAWASADLEGSAWRHASVAAPLDHARMQERVTGTVG